MNTDVQDLKIFKYVSTGNDDKLHYQLDFARDLLPHIALHKDIFFQANGRPIRVEYLDDQMEKMAQVRFNIEADSGNLVTLKEVWLAYVKNDGTLTEEILIKKYVYDEIKHATLRIKERIKARDWISNNIQIIAAGTLAYVLQKTIAEIEAMTANYFLQYDTHIRFFISKGSTAWLESLENDDFSAYPWMTDIPAFGGANLQQYLIARLSY